MKEKLVIKKELAAAKQIFYEQFIVLMEQQTRALEHIAQAIQHHPNC